MKNLQITPIVDFALLTQKQQDNPSPCCTLKWRQKQLLVSLPRHHKQLYFPKLENRQWLAECLKRSPVELIRIEPSLGEASLQLWTEASAQGNKAIFLQLPSVGELPNKRSPLSWWLKRLIDITLAALLLLLFGPGILLLSLLIRLQSSEPIFSHQWCVGKRGRLFRLVEFRTLSATMTKQSALYEGDEKNHLTALGSLMCKYNLDKLPQLFNVLRGEMSLVGPRPWTLNEAVRMSPSERQQLNLLPGIIGFAKQETRLNRKDLQTLKFCSIQYLHHWSLWQDLKILLFAFSKVLSSVSINCFTTIAQK